MVEKYIDETSLTGDKFKLSKLFSLSTSGNKSTSAAKNTKNTFLLWYGIDSTELLGVLFTGLKTKSRSMPPEM